MIIHDLVHFDIILGMEWLYPYHACLDNLSKTMTIANPGMPRLFKGTPSSCLKEVNSFLLTQCCVKKRCPYYLAYVHDTRVDPQPLLDSLRVIREFMDIFLTDLPGVSPNRDIDFAIDIEQGTKPIFISF